MKKNIFYVALLILSATLTGCVTSPVTSKEYKDYDPNMMVSNYDRIYVPSEIDLKIVKADTIGTNLVNTNELRNEIVSKLESKGIKVVKNASEKYVFSVDRLTGSGLSPRHNQASQITSVTGSAGIGFVGGALLKNVLGDSGTWDVRLSIRDSNNKVLREIKHLKAFTGMEHEDASETVSDYFGPKVCSEFFVLKKK